MNILFLLLLILKFFVEDFVSELTLLRDFARIAHECGIASTLACLPPRCTASLVKEMTAHG